MGSRDTEGSQVELVMAPDGVACRGHTCQAPGSVTEGTTRAAGRSGCGKVCRTLLEPDDEVPSSLVVLPCSEQEIRNQSQNMSKGEKQTPKSVMRGRI